MERICAADNNGKAVGRIAGALRPDKTSAEVGNKNLLLLIAISEAQCKGIVKI